jgi:hypothetical protein
MIIPFICSALPIHFNLIKSRSFFFTLDRALESDPLNHAAMGHGCHADPVEIPLKHYRKTLGNFEQFLCLSKLLVKDLSSMQ